MFRLTVSLIAWSLATAVAFGSQDAPPGVAREVLDSLNQALLREDPHPKVTSLASIHSLRSTEAFDQAAAQIASWAKNAGLEISVEDFAADGGSRYGAFLSEPGWRVRRATLRMIAPKDMELADWNDAPLALAWFSGSADVTTELIDVGGGTEAADYAGKEVQGKIVLANGPHRVVHREAVYARGAVGVVSDWHLFGDRYPNVLSSDGAGIRPWVGPNGSPPGFLFSISPPNAQALRKHLAESSRVMLEARVETETYPSHYRIVSAVVPGSSSPDEEVLIVNHLDSTQPGAVHNAAAALALIEAGNALSDLIRSGDLVRPARSVRFLWVPEHRGTMAYLLAHPKLKDRVVAAVNVDMPTARHSATGAVTYLYRTPDSAPSFADDVFGELLEWVRDHNTAQLGTDQFAYPVVAAEGSRESFYARVADYQGLSDHVEFIASGIPMGFFGTWPFHFLGTTRDTLEMFDATQLKRVSLVLAAGAYAIASAQDDDVSHLAYRFLNRAQKRLLDETSRQLAELSASPESEDPYVVYKFAMDALHWKQDRETRALATLRRLGDLELRPVTDSLRASAHYARQTLTQSYWSLCEKRGLVARETTPSVDEKRYRGWIPERTGALKGPLTRAYLQERLDRPLSEEESALFRRHFYASFEAWNFIDGERSVTDITQAVSAELGLAPLGEVLAFYGALEQAGLLHYRRSQ